MAIRDSKVLIRLATPADAPALAALCFALWPESPVEEHGGELDTFFAGRAPTTMPLAWLVAEARDSKLVGFVEVGLRSHADCCDTRQPVGFIEGWYVDPAFRRQGIGRRLIAAAEDWARSHGAKEMASDTQIDNAVSQRCHEALGYEAVSRAVNFRKKL